MIFKKKEKMPCRTSARLRSETRIATTAGHYCRTSTRLRSETRIATTATWPAGKRLCASLLLLACTTTTTTTRALRVYPPAPPGSGGEGGKRYNVTVAGRPSPVYVTAAPSDAPAPQRGKSVEWVSFDSDSHDPVLVEIRPGPEAAAPSWSRCVVRPLSLGATCDLGRGGSVATVGVPPPVAGRPVHLSVEFDGDLTHALLVFANPPDTSGKLRSLRHGRRSSRHADPNYPNYDDDDVHQDGDHVMNDRNIITFRPGLHDIGVGQLALRPNTTVRIEAGAWVRGTLSTHGTNIDGITVEGRGVLDGGLVAHPPKCTDRLAMVNLCGSDIAVRDITVINAPTYLVEVNAFWQPLCRGGSRTLVENVKLLAWHYTSDGIMVGRDAVVRDNFIKCNDDSLKVFMSNTVWQRNTIWQLDNGQSMMLSWITNTDEKNITVEDSTVIHVEHAKDYGDRARPSVIGAVHGGSGVLSGFVFRNITVEGPAFRPFGIVVAPNPWGGASSGTIEGVDLRGVDFLGPAASTSIIRGPGRPAPAAKAGAPGGGIDRAGADPIRIRDISFWGLQEDGKTVLAPEGRFDVGANTSNISFHRADGGGTAVSGGGGGGGGGGGE